MKGKGRVGAEREHGLDVQKEKEEKIKERHHKNLPDSGNKGVGGSIQG